MVGDREDLSATYVGWLARRRGGEVLDLPEDRFGVDWGFSVTEDGRDVIDLDGRTLELAELDGAFVRLNPRPPLPPELALSEELASVYAIERRYALHWLLDHAPFRVVNRPSCGRSNGSKPFQMAMLAKAGFRVPPWLVTNAPAAARSFIAAAPHGAVYKACSGLRSRVRLIDAALGKRLERGTTPVVLQHYVPGEDVRVHVVGSRTFATRVSAPGIDYRFESDSAHYEPNSVPDDVARLCVAFAQEEGLDLAGLDFRRDPDGEWWCLEANPVPTFLPYEAGSGQPIGDAILDLMAPGEEVRAEVSPLAALYAGGA
jgi:hypothetical protein